MNENVSMNNFSRMGRELINGFLISVAVEMAFF